MFCKNCGRQLPDNAAFCPGCGAKRSDGEAYADERSSADIRNLPNYAKEIDRSDHTVDSDRKKFSLSNSDRKKFSLSDPDRKKFSLSDSGRDKFSLSDKSRKGDDGGIVRLTSSREQPAPSKEPAAPQMEPAPSKVPVAPLKGPDVQAKAPAAQPKEPAGFVNPLKGSGGTVFRSGDTSDTTDTSSAKNATATTPAKDATADGPATFVRPEQTAPRESEAIPEENDDGQSGFVNPLKETGRDIHLGSDGDRNQPAEDVGEINSPHLKFAVWMVILSCTCCNPVTLILGIIALVFAFQVATISRRGNLGIALQKAAVARILCWITFGLLAAWISLLVAMLCLPMPEDRTEKKEVIFEENQTEQEDGENVENQTDQVEVENIENPAEQEDDQDVDHPAEQAGGDNIESTEPDIHHSPLNLLLDILD